MIRDLHVGEAETMLTEAPFSFGMVPAVRSGRLLVAGLIAVLGGFVALPADAQQGEKSRISDLMPIPLRQGVNRIERFAPDGRDAQIVLAWRDNGNAHSYDLFLVMLPGRVVAQDWYVVGVDRVEGDGRFQDVIVDQPHTGEDMVRSVRFARGRLDGQPATFLLTATREITAALPDPANVVLEVFRLVRNVDGPGATRDYFQRVSRTRTTTRFCNAEIALAREFGLPARRQADWPNTPTGCP